MAVQHAGSEREHTHGETMGSPEEDAAEEREVQAEELMAAMQLVEEGTVEGGSTEGPEGSTSVPAAEGTRLSSEP